MSPLPSSSAVGSLLLKRMTSKPPATQCPHTRSASADWTGRAGGSVFPQNHQTETGFVCQLRDAAHDTADTPKCAREQMHSPDGHWSFFFFNKRAHEGTFQCVRRVVMESFGLMASFRLASRASLTPVVKHSMLHTMTLSQSPRAPVCARLRCSHYRQISVFP